jgi:hypothetical protein
MQSNFSQYAPQGLNQLGNPWLGHELGQQGMGQHGIGQQAPAWAGQFNPFAPGQAANNSVQLVPALGQLAQQLTLQCALAQQIAQQIGSVVQHLAHQLTLQSQQGQQGQQGQYYGQNPFAASIQGGYSGFNPQAQAWGVNRPPTVQ